jgi:hypothetical protein
MAIIGAVLRLHPLSIVPVFAILHERNTSVNASSGSSSFCNGAFTGGSIRLNMEAKMNPNSARSDWLSASSFDERFASVHGFSDLEAGSAAEFQCLGEQRRVTLSSGFSGI